MRGKTGGLLAFFLAAFFTRVFQVEDFFKRFSECRCGMSWMSSSKSETQQAGVLRFGI